MTTQKTQVLFVQGGGEGTYADWDSKLVDSLRRALGEAYEVRYPQMPDEDNPDQARWGAAIRGELDALGEGAVLVGHSIGATILAHVLALDPPARAPAGLFLVAPAFKGEGGWPDKDTPAVEDLGQRLAGPWPIHLYQGDVDDIVPVEHLALYAQAIPRAVARTLPGRDHQLNDDLAEVAADIRALVDRR